MLLGLSQQDHDCGCKAAKSADDTGARIIAGLYRYELIVNTIQRYFIRRVWFNTPHRFTT